MTVSAADIERLLGRIYFLVLIPFIGAVALPWVLGPQTAATQPVLIYWSFATLVFCSAGWMGYQVGQGSGTVRVQLLICLVICASAVAMLMLGTRSPVAALGGLFLLHLMNLRWWQKTAQLPVEIAKQHRRFVWTLLACHMLAMLNGLYLGRI